MDRVTYGYARRRAVIAVGGNPFKHTYILDNGLYVPSDCLYPGKRVRVTGVRPCTQRHAFRVGDIVVCTELVPSQLYDRFQGDNDRDTLYPEEYENILL